MKNLEDILYFDYTWWNLFVVVLVFSALYLTLMFAKRIVIGATFTGRTRPFVLKMIDKSLILIEPIAVITVIAIFIVIRPTLHGLIAGLILLLGFVHIRNYIHGRLIHLYGVIKLGAHIKIDNREGIISEIGRLGLRIKSNDGLHYIPNHALIQSGYILSAVNEVGGYYNLRISANLIKERAQAIKVLSEVLISSPFIDGDHKPEISRSITTEDALDVKILVKEESHLFDLISVLKENEFSVVITKSS